MITRAILDFLINCLPSIFVPVEIMGAFAEAGSWIININHYIPISTFLACLAVYFVVWLICAGISAILQLL